MKVLCLISGRGVPSSRYRVLQYVRHLEARGHQCVVRSAAPQKYQAYPWLGWPLSARLRRVLRRLDLWESRVRRFDVIWLERELFDDPTYELEAAFARIAPVVLDVDDAIFLRYPEKFPVLARLAKVVLAGNGALRDAIAGWNSSVRVLPTSLDLADYQMRPPVDRSSVRPLVIGWTGTASNLPNLALAARPLRELARRFDIRLRVISDDDAPLRSIPWDSLQVEFLRWNTADQVPRLQQFDVGIMPLEDAEWQRYKCGLKALEYMAVGVPAVVSPVGVNAEIIRHEQNGLLATTEQEWLDGLQRLLQDPTLRERLGTAGRRTVEERYSVQANLPALEAALLEAAGSR